jgi:hypothetical protein
MCEECMLAPSATPDPQAFGERGRSMRGGVCTDLCQRRGDLTVAEAPAGSPRQPRACDGQAETPPRARSYATSFPSGDGSNAFTDACRSPCLVVCPPVGPGCCVAPLTPSLGPFRQGVIGRRPYEWLLSRPHQAPQARRTAFDRGSSTGQNFRKGSARVSGTHTEYRR